MKKPTVLIIGFTLLLFALTGCYTQLQLVDRSSDQEYYGQYENDNGEYLTDEADSSEYEYGYDESPEIVREIYYAPGFSGRYDLDWDVPSMWDNWGYYSGFYFNDYDYYYPYTANYWWYRSWYPFVTAYPYWDYYGNGWSGYGYGHQGYSYHKRPFNRRSEEHGRRIIRDGGERQNISNVGDSRRIIRRSALPASERSKVRSAGNHAHKRAIRKGSKSRKKSIHYRSRKARSHSRSYKPNKRSGKSKSSRSGKSYRSKKRSSSSRPSYRGSSTRSSGSRSSGNRSSGSSRSSSGSSSKSGSSSRTAKRR